MDQAATQPAQPETPAVLVDMDDLIFSEKMDQVAAAIVKAHSEIDKVVAKETADIKNDSGRTSYSYKYADLANVLAASKPALAANGLAILQPPSTVFDSRGAQTVVITTMLLHSSGQWCRSRLRMKPTQTTPQGIGSAITYGRRYAAQAILGIAPEDDDGKAASTSALTDSPAAASQNGQQKTAAPAAQQLRAMYTQARAITTTLPEDMRAWCEQNVEGYARGSALTEKQSWFIYNTLKELLTTPEGDDPLGAPPETTAETLEANLALPLTENQSKSIQILFREKGLKTEAQRHDFANQLIGKPSSKMWNQGDYVKVREALNALQTA